MLKKFNKYSLDDIVFENKNKSYGAYELRKSYAKRLLLAVAFAIFIVLIILIYPKNSPKKEKKYQVDEIVLLPLKKIKETNILEKNIEQAQQQFETETPKETLLEKPVENSASEQKNEAKLKIVENLEKAIPNQTETKKKDLEPSSKSTNNQASNQPSGAKETLQSNNNTGNEVVDAESVSYPAMYPGCEKYENDLKKLKDCFNNKIRDEVNFYLENTSVKRKSKETVYFEIDKQGNFINIKLDKGDKVNDVTAIGALKKISLDFNRRTNPSRRVKPAKDASGRAVSVRYNLPISFSLSEID